MTKYLDVNAVDLEAAEASAFHLGLDHSGELFVDDILVDVVFCVVKMDVLERVDVEIHLVVRTHPVPVDAHQRHLAEDVVDRGDGDVGVAPVIYPFRYLVGAGMSEIEHGFMDRESLRRSFKREFLEAGPVPVHRTGVLYGDAHIIGISLAKINKKR